MQCPQRKLIYSYLKYVVSRLHICDINPLAVYISVICIIATGAQTLTQKSKEVMQKRTTDEQEKSQIPVKPYSTTRDTESASSIMGSSCSPSVLPECERCRRSASDGQNHRWCPPDRSWPCVPPPLSGRC